MKKLKMYLELMLERLFNAYVLKKRFEKGDHLEVQPTKIKISTQHRSVRLWPKAPV